MKRGTGACLKLCILCLRVRQMENSIFLLKCCSRSYFICYKMNVMIDYNNYSNIYIIEQ